MERSIPKADSFCTPSVQRKAFKQTGITIATDGSEDDLELSKNLKALLGKFNESLVPTPQNKFELFSRMEPTFKPPVSMVGIFRILCAGAQKKNEQEFHREPVLYRMKKKVKGKFQNLK